MTAQDANKLIIICQLKYKQVNNDRCFRLNIYGRIQSSNKLTYQIIGKNITLFVKLKYCHLT